MFYGFSSDSFVLFVDASVICTGRIGLVEKRKCVHILGPVIETRLCACPLLIVHLFPLFFCCHFIRD